MPPYSPFGKPLERLQPSDRTALRDTKEGWYVEYKSEAVPARALAKSLSAFANTHGGWLFVGVKEESKDNAVAGDFPGVATSELDGLLQRLRHSAAEHMNPAPLFNTQVLRGPCSAINLAAGRAVVAVEIPRSVTTPHVHKDGRIYRRVADGSEPAPETDRFLLDQLWRRDRPIRRQVRRWIKADPEFSKAERDNPYVRILLCADPWSRRPIRVGMQFEEIQDVFTSNDDEAASTPYNTVHSTAGGILARQVTANDPRALALTWRMARDLTSDVIVPLAYQHVEEVDRLRPWLNGYAHSGEFIDALRNAGYSNVKVVDLNLLMHLLIATASKYRRLLRIAGLDPGYFFKARILNAWRVCPFIDTKSAISQFTTHGPPMLMDSAVTTPDGNDPDSFAEVLEPTESHNEHAESGSGVVQGLMMFTILARALGLRALGGRISREAPTDVYTEPIAAGERALQIQTSRPHRGG